MHDILEQASRAFDVPIKLIQSASRRPRYCTARFAVMYALREQGYSLAEIGEVLGNRDHTTIIYGLERAEVLAQTDPWFAQQLASLLPR
jgi:chromosomal replication initiator protein